jgi:nitrate reductase NapAB chaperone NapD
MILEPSYQEEPRRSSLKKRLEEMGFEVYEVGRSDVLVFYVEGDTIENLEQKIRAAEESEGVVKAYIAYAFLASDEVREWVNRAIESGEVVLDETTVRELRRILEALRGVEDARG